MDTSGRITNNNLQVDTFLQLLVELFNSDIVKFAQEGNEECVVLASVRL